MEQILRDTFGTGTLLWLAGYLASVAVYISWLDYVVRGRAPLSIIRTDPVPPRHRKDGGFS